MMLLNQKMARLLLNAASTNREMLPELAEILSLGFIEKNNSYFLKKFIHNFARASLDGRDSTGQEVFVNKVHIDMYTNHDQIGYAFLFALRLEEKWRFLQPDVRASVIIGVNDDGNAVVLFHLNRAGESWLAQDLESYQEDSLCVIEI